MRLTLFVLVALGAPACASKPQRADPQHNGQVDTPPYPAGMDLIAHGVTGHYDGSALFFRPDAPVDGLTGVVQAAAATRVSKAAWYDYRIATLEPRQKAVDDLRTLIDATTREAQSGPVVEAKQSGAARAWTGAALDALVGAGAYPDAAGRTNADAVWGAYCEAKIWELATAPLALATFSRHPTPLALCDAYYDAHGFFAGDRCAPEPNGKSYFSCLWQSGVALTHSFVGHYSGDFKTKPGVHKGATMLSWVESGLLATVIADPGRQAGLAQAALSQAKLKSTVVLGRDYKDYLDLFVPDQGTPSPAKTDLPLVAAAPNMLLNSVETGDKAVVSKALRFVPKDGVSADTAAQIDALHQSVLYFAHRAVTPPTLAAPYALSPSDATFNRLVPPLNDDGTSLATAGVRDRPEFAAIYKEMAPAYQAKLADLGTQRDAAAAVLATAKTQADALFSTFTEALRSGDAAASTDGVADALWIDSLLAIDAVGDGLYAVTFQLDSVNSRPARACWSEKALALADCPTPPSPGLAPLDAGTVRVDHDPATTQLAIEIDLADPAAAGLTLRDAGTATGSGNPFMAIDPATLKGTVLRAELYPARVGDGSFYYFSGKLFILDRTGGAQKILHEGAVNLLAD